jgi:hypothetical protein
MEGGGLRGAIGAVHGAPPARENAVASAQRRAVPGLPDDRPGDMVRSSEVRGPLQSFRLECDAFHVILRIREFNGRWIASADTPEGPTLGCGHSAFQAIWAALAPFGGAVGALLAALPDQVDL